jgi:hypothetical protein
MKEVNHALQLLLGQGRKDSKFFEELYLFVCLPLQGISYDNLIIFFVYNSEGSLYTAHRSSIPRLISHQSQLTESLP